MILKKIYLPVLFLILCCSSLAFAQFNLDKNNLYKKNTPIQIVSDKMEAFSEKRVVVFSGHAIATQGDIVLKSDRLSFFYKKQAGKKDKVGTQEIDAGGELERVDAKGNFSFTQNERIATGEEAVFYQETGQITLTGNPVLQEGKNTIKGCKVTIFLNENRGKVENCSTPEKKERVTAIIHPQGKSDK